MHHSRCTSLNDLAASRILRTSRQARQTARRSVSAALIVLAFYRTVLLGPECCPCCFLYSRFGVTARLRTRARATPRTDRSGPEPGHARSTAKLLAIATGRASSRNSTASSARRKLPRPTHSPYRTGKIRPAARTRKNLRPPSKTAAGFWKIGQPQRQLEVPVLSRGRVWCVPLLGPL